MKLITSPGALQTEFGGLIREHDRFFWATAWAGVGSKPFNQLVNARAKLRRVVVGLHFYQTHPDFIEEFLDHKAVRFIKQAEGTFHPKVYLFENDNGGWELLVGSGNFTNQAFTTNTEAAILITDSDENSAASRKAALAIINSNWNIAERFTPSELNDYRTTWKNLKPKAKSLSGQYGTEAKSKNPIFKVPVATMTWQKLMRSVRNDPFHSMQKRLNVLKRAREAFEEHDHFSHMSADERKFIAGLPNGLNTAQMDAGWFGSMRGSGRFAGRIAANNGNISRALDHIPLNGELTKAHFNAFVREYRKAFKGTFLAPATRLLAMKRPDTFVCLDSRNRSELCKAFGISQAMDYGKYWDDVVERIQDSEWWKNPEPKGKNEELVSQARAAFLDSVYYVEP